MHHADAERLVFAAVPQDVDGVTEKLAMCKAFFYSQSLDSECIKMGISNLLAGHPILAGRLGQETGQPCVWLNNAGMQFEHLQSLSATARFQVNALGTKNRKHDRPPGWVEVSRQSKLALAIVCVHICANMSVQIPYCYLPRQH